MLAGSDSSCSNRRRIPSFFVPWNRPLWIQPIRSVSMSNAIDIRPIGPICSLRPAPAIGRGSVCTLATKSDVEWAIPYRRHRQCIASILDANWLDVPSRRNRVPDLPCNRERTACRRKDWPNSIEAVLHDCAPVSPIDGWDFGRCSTDPMMKMLNLCVCTDPVEWETCNDKSKSIRIESRMIFTAL